jgi:hypothetical protein
MSSALPATLNAPCVTTADATVAENSQWETDQITISPTLVQATMPLQCLANNEVSRALLPPLQASHVVVMNPKSQVHLQLGFRLLSRLSVPISTLAANVTRKDHKSGSITDCALVAVMLPVHTVYGMRRNKIVGRSARFLGISW